MNIALSHRSGTEHSFLYEKWLGTFSTATFIAMNEVPVEEYQSVLRTCSGIVFTGGADVHPGLYGADNRLTECTIEPERDEKETILRDLSLELQIPILAICRGEQFFAVKHGGSLVVDIPTDIHQSMIHGKIEGKDSFHSITIEPRSLLHKLTKVDEAIVNSAHHQSIIDVPADFIATSFAPDGVIESIEWADTTGKPFFLGVQWHPERMDYSSSCSSSIAQHFMMEAESYSLLLR